MRSRSENEGLIFRAMQDCFLKLFKFMNSSALKLEIVLQTFLIY